MFQASQRVAANLKVISNGKNLDNFSKMSTISKNVCDAQGVIQNNPLNF